MGLLTPEFGLFFWSLVAFVLVAVLLKKFAWKPILGMLDERENKIADSIASAERVQQEMANLKADNERLLNEAREERSALLKEANDMKNKIIEDARQEAKNQASKMIEDAKLQINNEKNAALTEVKNEIGNLAVEVAEKILKQELSNEDVQKNYVNELTNSIKLN
ncbi:MAG TPA: F0F1 ATP synthase subunit B [Chitinophagaceae bacterium]|nr:F0F1 ATP synthase subunit B [Chitinophagaceae bacterium]